MRDRLKKIAAADIGQTAFDVPLSAHNSWRIGGMADLLVEPETLSQVATVVCMTRELGVPLVVIGQGTNLLFDDAGVRGVVMKIGASMAHLTIEGTKITAGAGIWVPQLTRVAMRAGLSGLEHCIGIPGTVGGLVMMNGGSHRRGIGEQVVRVTIVDKNGLIQYLNAAQCRFGYRYSALQERGSVVVEVELECPVGHKRQVRGDMLQDLRSRRVKFPRKKPNCGSVFLSTEEMHASVGPPGKIIEQAGLKGLRIGQAQVSVQHANFIVNLGGATATDVLQLISRIRAVIRERLDFDLCCEVRYVSPDGEIVPAHLKADQLFPAD